MCGLSRQTPQGRTGRALSSRTTPPTSSLRSSKPLTPTRPPPTRSSPTSSQSPHARWAPEYRPRSPWARSHSRYVVTVAHHWHAEYSALPSLAEAVHDPSGGQLTGGTDHARRSARGLRHGRGPVSAAAEVPGGAHPGPGGREGAVPADAREVLPALAGPVQPLPQPRGVEAVGRHRQRLHHRLLARGAGRADHVRSARGVLPAVRAAGGETHQGGRGPRVHAGRAALLHLLRRPGAPVLLAAADGGGRGGRGGAHRGESGAAAPLHRAAVAARGDQAGLHAGARAAGLHPDADLAGTAAVRPALRGQTPAALPGQSADGLPREGVSGRPAAVRSPFLGESPDH